MEVKDIQEQISNQLAGKLNHQIDEVIAEGLKRKGFEFNNRLELEEFIKTRCRVEDYLHLKEKRFFVDNEPFLLWNYEQKINPVYKDNRYTIEAEAGSFSFIN